MPDGAQTHNNGITSTYVENTSATVVKFPSIIGSPPHTWRILTVVVLLFYSLGITSTYVENTTVVLFCLIVL